MTNAVETTNLPLGNSAIPEVIKVGVIVVYRTDSIIEDILDDRRNSPDDGVGVTLEDVLEYIQQWAWGDIKDGPLTYVDGADENNVLYREEWYA